MSRRNIQRWRGGTNTAASSRSTNNSNSGSTRNIMRELNGHKLIPPETPPVFVGQPWNNLTLILRIKSSSNQETKILVEQVRVALRAQTGFNNVPDAPKSAGACHFDIRIKSMNVWAIDSQSMTLMPMDLIVSESELTRIDSNVQKNMFARAGYKLPLAQSSITLATAKVPSKVILILLGSAAFEVHINLLWKGADSALPIVQYTYPASTLKIRQRQLEAELAELKLLDDAESETSDFERCSEVSQLIHKD